MKTSVYIDGFNLDFGALKGTNFKWLNPVKLLHRLVQRDCVVDRPLHFTAWASGVPDKTVPIRQQSYVNSLSASPEVETYFGNLLTKPV